MECQKCGTRINNEDAMEIQGKTVCEDCYIDLAAKPKTCDPWAVYSAKNLSPSNISLNETQKKIIDYLRSNGPSTPRRITTDLNMTMDEFETEMAALRHMEKVRAQMQDGIKVIRLW